jgi:hypothetical protein
MKKMKIDTYTSATNGGKHLSVPAGTDLSKMPFPNTLHPDLHKVYPRKKSEDIQPGDSRTGMNSADIIDQINKNGFAVHDTTITITIK